MELNTLMKKKSNAFTLIELLVVLAILSIVAGIAYPSYQAFIIKTHRANAQSELIKAQIEQSSYRIIHPTYLSNANSAGLPTQHEHYTFSIEYASAHEYLLKAKVKTSSLQMNDERHCQTLYINQNNTKTSDGTIDNASCWMN